jgi:YVTN family beta-propeller protein
VRRWRGRPPTDFELLKAIYDLHREDYAERTKTIDLRSPGMAQQATFLPIDIDEVADRLALTATSSSAGSTTMVVTERRECDGRNSGLIDRQVPVLLEGASEAGERRTETPLGILLGDERRGRSASWSVIRPSSRAVISATTTLPFSIARLKIALGCPCAVNGPPGGAGRLVQPIRRLITHRDLPEPVAYGAGAVWVANSTDRSVTKINAVTGARTEIPVRAGADGIAVGDGAVWVTSESAGSVTRIDPRAGIETASINVGRGAGAVTTSPGGVWVANGLDGTVSRIDPRSNAVRAVITVGSGPSGVAATPDGKTVWVSSALAGTLSQIVGEKVTRTKKTGNRPEDVALSGDSAYVAVRTSGLVHRGDTLRVLESGPVSPIEIDPAAAYSSFSWPMMIMTNDGLVTYKRVGGSAGTRLVPDLATSIPIATDDGKTYTFQVRRRIHYSNGALVRPADFRRAIERTAGAPGTGFYFSNIVGYEACVKKPDRCDLSKGIVTDEASNTVTFHLTAPNPDFLLKLALPAGYAVPAGTPRKARLPLPATGPYMIASYDAKRGARLIRNPHFHIWYEAAQPDGYPDEIDWRVNVLPDAQRRAIEQGKADVAMEAGAANTGNFPPPALLATLRTRYASLLHINPALSIIGVSLNTRVPPFDDVRVRKAINYAVDRNRMVDLRGGPDHEQPTCQMPPPNIDGYRRYCPYTIAPNPDGRYTGPDLAEARRLVAASGTKGQEVTVAGIKGIFQPHGGDYFVSVLRSLGYKAHFRNFKDYDTYAAAVGDRAGRSRRASTAGSRTTPRPATSSRPCSRAAHLFPTRPPTRTMQSSATARSTPRSPAPARSRPPIREQPRDSGGRSTTTSSDRLPGCSSRIRPASTSSRAGSATTSTTRSGASS